MEKESAVKSRSDKEKYTSLLKLSLVDMGTEIPGFILVLAVALASDSLIMWLDAIDSFKNIFNIGLLIVMSVYLRKDLKYKFNYGTGKLESVGSIITDVMMILGMCFTVYSSISFFFNPEAPSDNLLYAIFLKFGNVVINVYFIMKQIKISKMGKNKLVESGLNRFIGNFFFDASAFLGVLFSYLFRGSRFSWYINPILCLGFSIAFIIICSRHIKSCIGELLDKTLPEDMQMRLIKVLTRHIDEYDGFVSLDSRKNGENVFVDITLRFSESTSYSQIEALNASLSEEIGEIAKGSIVRLIVGSRKTE